mmetsp:Transcript_29926/g.53130  ORF Transcript_29926/g.53130 Transcript_29926/m.53130 type:complete len:181 (-) Transcript_29926:1351-1893(-)
MDFSPARKAEAKGFLKIKLPTETFSGAMDLSPTKDLSPSVVSRRRDSMSQYKKEFPLPHLSLTIERRISSKDPCFRPSPRRPNSRFYRDARPRNARRVSTIGTGSLELYLHHFKPPVLSSLTDTPMARNSPVVSVRSKSPLTRLHQINQSKHRKAWSMFQATQHLSEMPTKLQKVAILTD